MGTLNIALVTVFIIEITQIKIFPKQKIATSAKLKCPNPQK
jgi:hypothetical protein